MKKHPARWSLVVLACLLASACQDRRDPVKPVAGISAGLGIGAIAQAPA